MPLAHWLICTEVQLLPSANTTPPTQLLWLRNQPWINTESTPLTCCSNTSSPTRTTVMSVTEMPAPKRISLWWPTLTFKELLITTSRPSPRLKT